MAEMIQMSDQQSRAKAKQSSKDRQRGLRKEWRDWVKAVRYRNAENKWQMRWARWKGLHGLDLA